jgi:hypothetical protein
VLNLKCPKSKPNYVTVRSFKNYRQESFVNDFSLVPWGVLDVFENVNHKLGLFKKLFTDILDVHAPVKRIKLKSKPNPFVTHEIRALMKTRDKWHRIELLSLKISAIGTVIGFLGTRSKKK